MAQWAWFTAAKIKEVKERLHALEDSTDLQIGSPTSMIELVSCVLELIEALEKEPGPSINHIV